MVSKLALFSNILLASVATMAVPSSQLGARLARGEGLQSHPSNRDVSESNESNDASANIVPDTTYTGNWAGAQVALGTVQFKIVTATFTIPNVLPIDGATYSGALVWVGVGSDDPTCHSILLSALRIRIQDDGTVLYNAVWQWYPATVPHYFPTNSIHPGDSITLSVSLLNPTLGRAVIVNHDKGWMMAQDITSPFFPLCERNALWIVEDYTTSPGTFIPFLHFGTVDFKNALAGLPGTNCHGPNSPEACTVLDATQIFDIVQNSKLLTFTSVMDLDEPILTVNNFIYD